jgi:hypothetical protein
MNPALYPGCPPLNPKGRPVGSKDKSHLLAETWSARLDTVWDDLKSAQKANICCRIFCALVSRQQSHLTPEESKRNADVAFALVQRMEKALGVNVTAGSPAGSARRVGDGPPSVQVVSTTADGV